jgi:two-component system NtrC family response regulator
MTHVLIIDDNRHHSSNIHELVKRKGYDASLVSNLKEAMHLTRKQEIDVVLMNTRTAEWKYSSGMQQLCNTPSAPEVIVIAENGNAEEAEIAIRNGAWDYIVKSNLPQSIISPLSQVIRYREKKQRQQLSAEPLKMKNHGIIGNNAKLQACLKSLSQSAGSDASVLITGETGTGKELFATALHENSNRAARNFVVVDCAALPETLIESTLFGHEKGAFTGANQKQTGLVKQADGGTLFLDEIGELPLSMQKAFLRVLEERSFRPVGGEKEIRSNFRLVAATNQDLDAMVENGTFRNDLLFRLRTFHLQLPPLRSRLGDIPALIKYFVTRTRKNNPSFQKHITPEFLSALRKYNWPGNVRELFHALERSLTAAEDCSGLYPKHLPTHIRVQIARGSLPRGAGSENPAPDQDESWETEEHAPTVFHALNPLQNLQDLRNEVLTKTENQYLQQLMAVTSGNIREAIKISGLSRSRLYQLLKDHGVQPSPPIPENPVYMKVSAG